MLLYPFDRTNKIPETRKPNLTARSEINHGTGRKQQRQAGGVLQTTRGLLRVPAQQEGERED